VRIRDVEVEDVIAGRNWRLKDDAAPEMVDWEIETCSDFRASDTVVYSALAVFETGEVRPLLVIREVGTYEWWGDTCEYVGGAWRALGRADEWRAETYVGAPLENDPSFMGEYSHERQRDGFARWRDRLPTRRLT
jgi:hypothetical protein